MIIVKTSVTKPEKSYPWIGTYGGVIILFVSEQKGVVISSQGVCTGECIANIVESNYLKYEGELVLKNI